MNVLSSSCGIIMDRAINAPGHGKNIVDGINSTDKPYLKGKMRLIGKLVSNDTTNIGILPGASKDASIKFSNKCLHILNNKEIFHGLKGSTKMKIIEPLFKYQSRIYKVQSNSDVNHRCMKMIWNDNCLRN